ncbi:MAG: hypothetical protein ABFD49_08005 [Armatimonadota bacterium]|nr:hypothetical protein [bacterium]
MALCIILAVCALTCRASGLSAFHSPLSTRGKVVVVVANRLTLDDLDDPSLHAITRMIRGGAVGLISPNCSGGKNEFSCMITAGAGASCRGGVYLREFYDSQERIESGASAGDAYSRRTGYAADPGSAVFLGLGLALRANTELAKPAVLGALGDTLHEAGRKTCAIGNADILPGGINRATAVLAMDSRGFIDRGCLNANSSNLSGLARADFVVINFSGSTLLDESKNSMTDKALAIHKAEVMRDLDRLIDGLMRKSRDENVSVILVSFGLPVGDPWERLTPIVIYGQTASGVLKSPTTRTLGLVAASDFAPTVLDLFGIPARPEMVGRAARVQSVGDKLAALRDLENRVRTHQTVVEPVIYVIMAIGAVTFISAMIALGFPLLVSRKVLVLIKAGLVTGCASAPAMLLAVLAPAGVASHLVGLILFWVLITAASFVLGRKMRLPGAPMLVVFALCVSTIFVDAFAGGALCKFAIPSQFQLSGFRYYGIGNEYAGILIAMCAMVAVLSGERVRLWLALVFGVVLVLALGLGQYGANYGGTITAVVTFGLLIIGLRRGQFGMRHVIGVFVYGIGLLALLAFRDSVSAGQTAAHAGRMASLVQKVGGGYVLSLIARKVLLNLRIAAHPEAVLAYIVLIPICLFWAYRIPARLKEEIFRDKSVAASLKGLLIGMLVALLFNDSGIVMALLMFGMMSSLLIYLMIEKEARRCPE